MKFYMSFRFFEIIERLGMYLLKRQHISTDCFREVTVKSIGKIIQQYRDQSVYNKTKMCDISPGFHSHHILD